MVLSAKAAKSSRAVVDGYCADGRNVMIVRTLRASLREHTH
jgi:hypothetical protein